METQLTLPGDIQGPARMHLENVAGNLQFVADLGYGDVALAVPAVGGLLVVADARPMTAVAAVASSRVGLLLDADTEPESHRALLQGAVIHGERRRSTRGISYVTSAYAVGRGEHPYGVIVRDLSQYVAEAPGKMERVFMFLAERVLDVLCQGPLVDVDGETSFATTRRAGDGVMEVDGAGIVTYSSPNAVNIMRMAGWDGGLDDQRVVELPGCSSVVAPVLGTGTAHAATVEVSGRVLRVRAIDLYEGAVVLVEDITDVRRREQELKVKEATIREVHHRVKNNLQTIASLLRIQARRSDNREVSRSLEEAVERVSSMAVVHEMLAASTEELVDLAAAARVVVDMVRQGLGGGDSDVSVTVEGETGLVPAATATSLALVTVELVHNAIEHGLGQRQGGIVNVLMRRFADEIHLVVRDDGAGLSLGFDVAKDANLGLAIVRTLVEDDLQGTLDFSVGRGTTVTVRVPVPETAKEGE
ncbi:MAG: histidine kinase N-terminal domain-containing protein [Coriobacteriia bacterium]|nr:histidine kinase N-terminal domain-containing protein [Coriobacteriia bacterium]MBN2823011.1 histidine kinase N-terminal domain-containing protein [Coriobacteriia bacterium]